MKGSAAVDEIWFETAVDKFHAGSVSTLEPAMAGDDPVLAAEARRDATFGTMSANDGARRGLGRIADTRTLSRRRARPSRSPAVLAPISAAQIRFRVERVPSMSTKGFGGDDAGEGFGRHLGGRTCRRRCRRTRRDPRRS